MLAGFPSAFIRGTRASGVAGARLDLARLWQLRMPLHQWRRRPRALRAVDQVESEPRLAQAGKLLLMDKRRRAMAVELVCDLPEATLWAQTGNARLYGVGQPAGQRPGRLTESTHKAFTVCRPSRSL